MKTTEMKLLGRREFLSGSLLTAAGALALRFPHSARAADSRDETVAVKNGTLVFKFAPASVTRLQLTLV